MNDLTEDAPVTYINPILNGDRPDPAILKDGDDYWLTYSSFENAPGLLIYHSTDLINWTFATAALENPLGSVFAVDIAKHNGRYFIYIPFIPTPWSALDAAAICVIHADSMLGPWSQPIDLGIREAIDPGHLVGEDGKRYLFVNGVRRIKLSDDGLSTDGVLEKVYDGWRYPDDWVTEAYALEGPKLFQKDGWFYLVSAVGGTAGPPTGHMVIVARSTSVHGPWENCPHNPIVRTWNKSEEWWSRGHATFLPDSSDNWWTVYHGYQNGYQTLGRQILLEPLSWGEDGWPRAMGGDLSTPQAAPAGAQPQPAHVTFADDFQTPILGERWTFHAPAPDEAQRAVFGAEGLILQAKGTDPGSSSPLTLLPADHCYETQVSVTLDDPATEGGLLLFFNSRLFCGFGLAGGRMITYSGGQRSHWKQPMEPMQPTTTVDLRIVNDHHIITMWFRPAQGQWTRHGMRLETAGYHANTIGDLNSLRPAIYSTNHGSVRFNNFSYRSLSMD